VFELLPPPRQDDLRPPAERDAEFVADLLPEALDGGDDLFGLARVVARRSGGFVSCAGPAGHRSPSS